MKITIESTDRIVSASGIECRVWEGRTECGVAIICLVPRIAVRQEEDVAQFDAELERRPQPAASPDAVDAFPLSFDL